MNSWSFKQPALKIVFHHVGMKRYFSACQWANPSRNWLRNIDLRSSCQTVSSWSEVEKGFEGTFPQLVQKRHVQNDFLWGINQQCRCFPGGWNQFWSYQWGRHWKKGCQHIKKTITSTQFSLIWPHLAGPWINDAPDGLKRHWSCACWTWVTCLKSWKHTSCWIQLRLKHVRAYQPARCACLITF